MRGRCCSGMVNAGCGVTVVRCRWWWMRCGEGDEVGQAECATVPRLRPRDETFSLPTRWWRRRARRRARPHLLPLPSASDVQATLWRAREAGEQRTSEQWPAFTRGQESLRAVMHALMSVAVTHSSDPGPRRGAPASPSVTSSAAPGVEEGHTARVAGRGLHARKLCPCAAAPSSRVGTCNSCERDRRDEGHCVSDSHTTPAIAICPLPCVTQPSGRRERCRRKATNAPRAALRPITASLFTKYNSFFLCCDRRCERGCCCATTSAREAQPQTLSSTPSCTCSHNLARDWCRCSERACGRADAKSEQAPASHSKLPPHRHRRCKQLCWCSGEDVR